MIRSRGLTHIQLAVRDVARSVRFYKAVFGMEDKFAPDQTTAFLTTPGREDILTLHQGDDRMGVAGTLGGVAHFGFHVEGTEDFEQALLAAEGNGGTVLRRGTRTTASNPREPWAFVTDPDGYKVEVYSPTA